MAADVEMVQLFRAELELCAVGPGQTVAVLTEGDIRADYAEAFLIAGQSLGGTMFQINIPKKPRHDSKHMVGKTSLAGNRPAIEALKSAHMVVDLMGLLFSEEQTEITATGTRMLMVKEPMDVLRQLFPDRDLRARVEFGEKLLRAASELRITSKAGTDLRYAMGRYPVMTEYGYTDTPGRWDHWPSGFLLSQGNDGEVDGTVVLQPGDIINAFRRYVQSTVRLTVERGMVVDIAGEGMDAVLIKTYIESFNDPRAFAVSHIGWGLNQKAKWFHNATTRSIDREVGVNALAFHGNVLFSLGPNTELGGTNDTACHLDIPLRKCSLFLDGRPVVEDGHVVPVEMQAA
jgi:2,5-dihydroxypyridine 5,6-dioxygenase